MTARRPQPTEMARLFALLVACLITGTPAVGKAEDGADALSQATVSQVVVTASRRDLLGVAQTASQGSVTKAEVDLRPIYRIGQLFETVPGLVVTIHSGEGKANQYLLRGFNLDHGTDFGSFVDGMPVNRPTNAHGQGYSDQNFLMAQLVDGLDFTKGPYYAATGDFGAVGSAHIRLVNDLADQISGTIGTLRDEDLFLAGTQHFDSEDRLWAAFDVGHLDGPWSPPSGFSKINFTTRFSHGSDANGYSLTGMYYRSVGGLQTDQSVYALQNGLIGRYGTLDPTDRSRSERLSLSGHYGLTGDGWKFAANLYAMHNSMTLWNNFTHYLFDPVNGDQEQQDETRTTVGGDVSLKFSDTIGSIHSDTIVGIQERHDDVYVDRRHTKDRAILSYCDLASVDGTYGTPYAAVGGDCSADKVGLNDLGLFLEHTTRWTEWLRTVVGLREEAYSAHDHSLTAAIHARGSESLIQPKGSLILGPWLKTELYLSSGRGFHSNDVRGVFETVPLEGIQSLGVKTPLMSPATGEEVGLRTNILPKVQAQVAVFQEDFNSEVAYDADQGEDQPSAPSRRQGIELSGQYHPLAWLELNTDLAFSKARYRGTFSDLAAFGLNGPFIANAPSFIGSFGILVNNLGPWFGGLQWRDLGPFPVNDGSQYPQGKGYSEVNADVGYNFSDRLKFQFGVYNLTNTKAEAAAYYYASRLVPGGPEVAGLQVHPLEPISVKFTVTVKN